jgi:hypothetical protein
MSVQTRVWFQKVSVKSCVPVSMILKITPLPVTALVLTPS